MCGKRSVTFRGRRQSWHGSKLLAMQARLNSPESALPRCKRTRKGARSSTPPDNKAHQKVKPWVKKPRPGEPSGACHTASEGWCIPKPGRCYTRLKMVNNNLVQMRNIAG